MERKETVLRFGLYIEELDEPVLSLLDELNGGVVLRLEGDEILDTCTLEIPRELPSANTNIGEIRTENSLDGRPF